MIHNTEKTPTTGTAVTIDELNTNGGVVFNGTATPYVKELNLLGNEGTNTNSSTTVLTTLKADVINIAAGVQENTETTAVELVASGAMTIMGEINADAVINNSGSVICATDVILFQVSPFTPFTFHNCITLLRFLLRV